MAIFENKQDKTFTLFTESTMYQMRVDSIGVLQHVYYGKRMEYTNMSYSVYEGNTSFSPNPLATGWTYSNNHVPQELSVTGIGDFRINALALRNSDGSLAADPRFYSAEILKGKYSIPGLPAFYGEDGETLVITLKDEAYEIYYHLYYGVFEKYDLITRSLRIENKTDKEIKLERIRRLDSFVQNFSMILSLVIGIMGALIFGLGMAMILVWDIMVFGIIVCLVGTAPISAAYPVYVITLKNNKEKYGKEILRLSDELLEKK